MNLHESAYRISFDGEAVATASTLNGLDLFGGVALPSVFDIDVIHAGLTEGLTGWGWGTIAQQVRGVVPISRGGLGISRWRGPAPDRCW